MTTRAEYARRYGAILAADIARRPADYGAGTGAELRARLAEIPDTVDRMLSAIAAGTAGTAGSRPLRRLAAELGYPHTIAGHRAAVLALTVDPLPAVRCRYCGSGGCRRPVVASLLSDGTGAVPLCAVAAAAIAAAIAAHGTNVNAAGQSLTVDYGAPMA